MRKHPEIRWRRQPSDLIAHQAIQKKLIERLSHHVRAGGIFVYSVCSFTKEESPSCPKGFSLLERWQTPPLKSSEWTVTLSLLPSLDF